MGNECSAGTANCDANAACTNGDGSFTCNCNSGYTGGGVSCQQVSPANATPSPSSQTSQLVAAAAVELQLAEADFTQELQQLFRESMAVVAEVDPEQVIITNITPVVVSSRRLLSDGEPM